MLTSVGQVYPRSLDLDVVSSLVQLAAGPSSLATTIRLMAGQELATEGFQAGQVGSSAMPHKMNTRSCERVNGLAVVLRGYLSMVGELAGAQWNEGDVFCSVVRRVALPDAFFAADGLFETFLTVLDEFGAYPAVVARELDRYLPFLATTKVLMAAVRAGVGREQAHEAIKEHAVAVALACASRARRTTTCSTGWPPTRGSGCPAPSWTRWSPTRGLHRRGRRPGGGGRRAGRGRRRRHPEPPRTYAPAPDPLAAPPRTRFLGDHAAVRSPTCMISGDHRGADLRVRSRSHVPWLISASDHAGPVGHLARYWRQVWR